LSANQQNEINIAFANAARQFCLALRIRGNGTDFVGTAVRYIGIPISLWDGFLDICEWALWRKDWDTLATAEWREVIHKRCGGRQRLKRFLADNPESAGSFIQEILDAREILTTDPSLTIANIAQASILRSEYFDEVPETAEFLRPQNPGSLFQDRAAGRILDGCGSGHDRCSTQTGGRSMIGTRQHRLRLDLDIGSLDGRRSGRERFGFVGRRPHFRSPIHPHDSRKTHKNRSSANLGCCHPKRLLSGTTTLN
jgi:hypothetical protein